MKAFALSCKVEARRDAVRAAPNLYGLDYLEVSQSQMDLRVTFLGKAPARIDSPNVVIEGGQRITGIRVKNLRVFRIDDPDLDDYMVVTVDHSGDFSTYTLRVVEADENGLPVFRGDSQTGDKFVVLRGFDPHYASLDFSFKASCPSDLDCADTTTCPPPVRVQPEINYLAKDYGSFRQLILDRLALIMPDWQERHIPDLGIALVEVLAYVGDYLSYYQDAVATEAYLDTARQRISVRRHARLVDYLMHEGCNARTWVCISTDTNWLLDPKLTYFVSGLSGGEANARIVSPEELLKLPANSYEVFEVFRRPGELKSARFINLYIDHSEIHFYTWGDQDCCLPRGATSATLIGAWSAPPDLSAGGNPNGAANSPVGRAGAQPPEGREANAKPQCQLHLQAGDILVFEEILGPRTGIPADADPAHRHAVRLTAVTPSVDSLYGQPIVDIEWGAEDALPFSLCISSTSQAPACAYLQNVSVAHGNVILVDHGRTQTDSPDPGVVGRKTSIAPCPGECQPAEVSAIPELYRPQLPSKPLTFSQPYDSNGPASDALMQDPRQALPWILLDSIPPAPDYSAPLFVFDDIAHPSSIAKRLKNPNPHDTAALVLSAFLSIETRKKLADWDGIQSLENDKDNLGQSLHDELALLLESWMPRGDLLQSGATDRHFVVEMDDEGWAHLRFGDGDLGQMPGAATAFRATYRVGNGPSGNVGAEAISFIVTDQAKGVNLRPRNPFAAQSGLAAESLAEVKLFAPGAFRKKLERAITSDDYASIAARNPKLQRAGATLRWNGSWYEELVAIDPLGTERVSAGLTAEISNYLYPFRRMGHDLVVAPAEYVPLKITIRVCVLPHYLRGHVEAELLDVLGNRRLPDGRLGFFHPDNLTFGEGVDLSRLVAAAQSVKGVESVEVTKFHRLFELPNREIENGILPLDPFEIAQLDNDPTYPEHGVLSLIMRGGR
jgi:hypothetical protein